LTAGALVLPAVLPAQQKIFTGQDGEINFSSHAPQELIRARSTQLKGALESTGKTFSFKVTIASFDGFNGALQKTHFHENYMESNRYPEATFKGKIIEDIDWAREGRYEVRAKGILTIHGVEQERIIRGELVLGKNQAIISCSFTVLLPDHNIPIPRIVQEKLAREIEVTVKSTLQLRQ
jgi:hypothetical protein